MSDSQKPAGLPFNTAWLLLLLVPAGLLAGHFLGNLPVPAAKDTGRTPGARAPASTAGLVATAPGADVSGGGERWMTRNSGPVQWVSLASAMDQARDSGKPVLFDFNADWCPPCQRMKHDVFENDTYARTVERVVVPVSVVDRYRETGTNPREIQELQQRYNIEAFPTLVVLSPRTGRYVSQAGFGGAEYTAQWIAAAAEQVSK